MNKYGNRQEERDNKDKEVEEKEDMENTMEVELVQAIVNSIEVKNHTEVERLDEFIVCLEELVV